MKMNNFEITVIPEPKKVKRERGCFILDQNVAMVNSKDMNSLVHFLRGEIKERFNLTIPINIQGKKRSICLKLEASESLPPQGYSLKIGEAGVNLIGKDVRSLFYGVQTLLSLVKKTRGQYVIPCLEILDWPDLAIRGIHLNFWTNVPKFPLMVKMIKELARHKINLIIFEYDNRFPYASHPAIASKNAFTIEQWQKIIEIASQYQIELIPLVDSLGHAEHYLKHTEYAGLKELPDQTAEMCPLNPGTLKLVQDLCRDLFPLHPSKYFHIGGDEVFRLGDFCPKCREFISKKGKSALYVAYYSQLCNWLKAQGKIPILWGDMFIKHPEAIDEFPKNVIIMDWDYSGIDSDTTSYALYNITTERTLRNLPPHIIKTFKPYWQNKYYPKKFRAYPYVRFFQDHGFRVIGASASSMPDYSGRYNNNRMFSRRLVSEGALGLVNTHWSGTMSTESAWHALLACAEYSWNSSGASRKEFDRKFVFSHYGADSKVCKITEGMTRIENVLCPGKNEGVISRNKIVARKKEAGRAFNLIQTAETKIRKNPVQAEYLQVIARMGKIMTEMELLFFDAENILGGFSKNSKYSFVDISRYVNHDPRLFSNLNTFPYGKLNVRGLSFQVINPDKNAGKSAIFLKGSNYDARKYPKEVRGIPVNSNFNRLYFLHSGGWVFPDKEGEKVAEYRVRYADGSESVKEVLNGETIGDSYGSGPAPQMKDAFVAWKGDIALGYLPYGLVYIACWDNPFPEKTIQSIDLVSFKNSLPIIMAITGEIKKGKNPVNSVKVKNLIADLHALKKETVAFKKSAVANFHKFLAPAEKEPSLPNNFSTEKIAEKIDSMIDKLKPIFYS